MMRYFNTAIKPEHEKLIEMLKRHKVEQDNDVMSIPVTVTHKSGTIQVIEDGLMMLCNHAGAYEQTKSSLSIVGDFASGNYRMNWKDAEVLTCDRENCNAQKGDDGEWYE